MMVLFLTDFLFLLFDLFLLFTLKLINLLLLDLILLHLSLQSQFLNLGHLDHALFSFLFRVLLVLPFDIDNGSILQSVAFG